MPFVLVAPPAAEPLTQAEVENHLRLEAGVDAVKVNSLILVARQHVERVTSRALVEQSWELVLDRFPACREIRLAKGDLRSVTSVKYLDRDGVEQPLDAAAYQVDTARVPGRVVLAPGESWPATSDRINAVRIRFVAGFGAAAAAVPEPIKAAMYLLIGHLYEHRESEVVGTTVSPLQMAVNALLAPYVLHGV
jgi:uncharacterized phiE125 gp8 family phage protein